MHSVFGLKHLLILAACAAAIVGGAAFEETLANPVKAVTPAAEALGVTIGMTGAEAVEKLNA